MFFSVWADQQASPAWTVGSSPALRLCSSNRPDDNHQRQFVTASSTPLMFYVFYMPRVLSGKQLLFRVFSLRCTRLCFPPFICFLNFSTSVYSSCWLICYKIVLLFTNCMIVVHLFIVTWLAKV